MLYAEKHSKHNRKHKANKQNKKHLSTFSKVLALLRWRARTLNFRFQPLQIQLAPYLSGTNDSTKHRVLCYSHRRIQWSNKPSRAPHRRSRKEAMRNLNWRTDRLPSLSPSTGPGWCWGSGVTCKRGRAHWVDAPRTGLPAPGWDSPVMWKSGVTSPHPGISESKSEPVAFLACTLTCCTFISSFINDIWTIIVNK